MKQIEKETVLEVQEFELNISDAVIDDDYFQFIDLCKACGLHLIDYTKIYRFTNLYTKTKDYCVQNLDVVGKLEVSGGVECVRLAITSYRYGTILTSMIKSCTKKGNGIFLIETLNSVYALKEISE